MTFACGEAQTGKNFRTDCHACLLVFVLGLLSRLFFVCCSSFESGDGFDYSAIAHNLLLHRSFSISPDSPTIFRAPGYPSFIAIVQSVGGENHSCVWVAQAVLGAVAGTLLYLILRRSFSRNIALFTALAAALYPQLSFYSGTLLSETLLSALLVLLYYSLIRAGEGKSPAWLVTAGAVTACAILISPRFVILPFLVVASWYLNDRMPRRKQASGFLLATCLLFLAPWTIRNKLVFGVWNPSATQSPGLQFWLTTKRVAVYDYAWTDLRRTEPLLQRYDVLYREEKSRELQNFPERQALDRAMFRDGIRTVADDPLGYLGDRLKKYPQLWIQPAPYCGYFHPPFAIHNLSLGDMVKQGAYGPLLLRIGAIVAFVLLPAALVLCGLVLLLPQWRSYFLPYSLFLWIAVIHFPLYTEQRYSLVIHPLLAVFSAAALERFLKWWTRTDTV